MKLSKHLTISSSLVYLSVVVLILTYTLNNLFSGEFNVTLWLLQVSPLGLMLPGLFKRNLRSYQWLCFLILIYFTQGVLNLFTPGKVLLGAIESFFCLLLSCSAIYFVYATNKLHASMRDS